MDTHATPQKLEAFRDHAADMVEQVRQTRRAITLTMDGQDAAVVLDVEPHRRLRRLAAQASAEEGIRQGLEDIEAGRVRPAQPVFDEFRPSMALRVELSLRAEQDLDDFFLGIGAAASEQAAT